MGKEINIDMWKKRMICILMSVSMMTSLLPASVMATGTEQTSDEQQIVYSENTPVRFEGKKPVYQEDEGKQTLKIVRTEKVDDEMTMTVQIYDNSANYEKDYLLQYAGREIPKIEGSTSIYDAFRDKGELTSNLPVDAAEQIVVYDDSVQSEESLSAADMLGQIRELGVMSAEFEVSFEKGETSKELSIHVIDDSVSEYGEDFMIVLLDEEDEVYEKGQMMVSILDDEEKPSVHVAFDCEKTVQLNEDSEMAELTFKRTGNLAIGTNAVLNFNGEPMGYVDFAPHQNTQVVLALAGTYTLSSDGDYTVDEATVIVKAVEKEIPSGADPELDAVPDEYAVIPTLREGSRPSWFPDWAKEYNGTYEDEDCIIVMGSESNCLFKEDYHTTDGSFNFQSEKNELKLNTEGGNSSGRMVVRTKEKYDLTGIESVEGAMWVSELTRGYGDAILSVDIDYIDDASLTHKKYNKDNDSKQNLKVNLAKKNQDNKYIYYANGDLSPKWDVGWIAYTPNGFKMNKRIYKITLANPEPLSFTKGSYAPSLTGSKSAEYTMGSDSKINVSYSTDSDYPVELVGFQFLDNKQNVSKTYSLNQNFITFDRDFLKSYESNWCYTDEKGMECFTIRPVFAKVEVDYKVNKTNTGTISMESPADGTLYKGETAVFTGNGKNGATFTGVAYQCRKSAGGEILEWGVQGAIGGKVSFPIESAAYGHYTFEGVFEAGADQLIVNYKNETSKKNGVLFTEGLIVDKDVYDISNYVPLMADANDGYVTEWNVNDKKFYGDSFNYQLTGLPSDNTVTVDFIKESSLSMSEGKITGYLTRASENMLNGISKDIILANTEFVVTTSHGEHSGKTDENGYFEIDNFKGVTGGTYSIAANYQNRTGFVTFVYNGSGKQTFRFPEYPAGGFYPVDVIATVDGAGYNQNYIYLTSAGNVEIMADIYVHSDDYEITNVTFHFLSNEAENYGDKLKEYEAAYDPDTNLGGKHQAWRFEINDTTALPKRTHMYVTVTANYPYTYVENGVTKTDYTTFTTNLADTGYDLDEPLNEEVMLIHQDIPEIPGLQDVSLKKESSSRLRSAVDYEDNSVLLDIPVIGTFDMSVMSSTGGYFVQKGSWKEDGDVYTLVCGHSTQPVFGVGTVKDRYDGAKKTKDALKRKKAGDREGAAELRQMQTPKIQIYPVFYMKFTVQTKAEPTTDNPDNLEHYLTGFEAALGIDAFFRANVPFMAGPVPLYLFIAITAEAYVQLQALTSEETKIGEEYVLGESEVNAFFNAPIMEFALRGGIGVNFFASVYGEGSATLPFIIDLGTWDGAGEVDYALGVGVEVVGFSADFMFTPDEKSTYGKKELLDELLSISEQADDPEDDPSNVRKVRKKSFDTIEEGMANATFAIMDRPEQKQTVLRKGNINSQKLASAVFMNTKIHLARLGGDKVITFFLTDNQVEKDNLNYLSVAYSISNDNGKTWSEVEFVSENITQNSSSYQYDIKVFELDDRLLVTWSEANVDKILEGADLNNLTASQIAEVTSAMNLKGRFFDMEKGNPLGETFTIAENSTVFCGSLDAVQTGDMVYVYYQRNAFPTGDDVTLDDILENERTIAVASAKINDTANWTSEPIRATTENGKEYRIVDVVPFVHDGIRGEVLVLDRNGRLSLYDEEKKELIPDIEDWQMYLRTYESDENGKPVTTALTAITDQGDCARNPKVLSTQDDFYVFWNQNGNIVYTKDLVARDSDSEQVRENAYVIANSDGTYKMQTPLEEGAASIGVDETLNIDSDFTASISEDGNILVSWIAPDKEDEISISTDEIYGVMLKTYERTEIVEKEEAILAGLEAKGRPVALTDGDSIIGALDSLSMKSNQEDEFLLAYSQLDGKTRRKSTSADIYTQNNVDKPEPGVTIEAPDYPMPGEKMTVEVTVDNQGFEPLNGYKLTVSGIGKPVTVIKEDEVLPGWSIDVPVEITVPKDFNQTSILKVTVEGLGNQEKYSASTETEVYYGSYFVPMDIPEVQSVPNSTDALVKVRVRNEGNVAGKVNLNIINQIYASVDKNDVKEYTFESEEEITPAGEATISYQMKETLMDKDIYSTVEVWTGEGHDQGTEAPMTKPVTILAKDVSSENEELVYPDDTDKPNEPDKPADSDNMSESEKSEQAKTGDAANLGIYLGVMLLALAAIVVVLVRRRKNR